GLYFLPGVVMALPAGAAGRRFGDKRVLMLGLALMVAGGALTSVADSATMLAIGRGSSGIGAVLLNVLMSKMVTDWFAGREIVLAMAIFVNSFPIGIGLALLSLGWLAESAGWALALGVSAAFALAALLLVGTAYRKHDNDGRPAGSIAAGGRLSRAELALVCIAGAIWGIYNGAFAVMSGFVPTFLAAAGYPVARAGFVIAASTWIVVASIQLGGLAAQHWKRAWPLMALGIGGWSACLAGLASGFATPEAMLIGAGLLMGLPVGLIMSLPAQVLRPENRALGMGVFYLWLYVGHGGVPPLAGWVQDATGSQAAPLYLASALALSILALYAAFRAGIAARARSAAAAVPR
ncbi:MAG TPA: MFS transporter, partial [Burkholderiaceae bacterium]|nr:MFS transporter [Burkholderiaceae bacterium]